VKARVFEAHEVGHCGGIHVMVAAMSMVTEEGIIGMEIGKGWKEEKLKAVSSLLHACSAHVAGTGSW
jgi:hypothetical protein